MELLSFFNCTAVSLQNMILSKKGWFFETK